jgi:hypothetical protein
MKTKVKLCALSSVAMMMMLSASAMSADHVDSPSVISDSATDITDLYAWMDNSGDNLNLILNMAAADANTAFSDAVHYVFHVVSQSAYGAPDKTETLIICKFDSAQVASCWAGNDEYVKGDASNTTGISSSSGKLKVFAGQRNDPFFFNLTGFNATLAIVQGAASSLAFNTAGCPALDAATSTALVTQLSSGESGASAADDFAGGNVLSLAIQVDKSVVNTGGAILGIWASTRR